LVFHHSSPLRYRVITIIIVVTSCSGDLPQFVPLWSNPASQVQTRCDEQMESVERQWSLDTQVPPRGDFRTSHTSITTRFT